MTQSVEQIVGYSVCAQPAQAICDEIVKHIHKTMNRPYFLACLNPHSSVVARGDEAFRQALKGATCLVPDGAGIVLASRMLGGNIRERVTGYDIFEGVMQRLDKAQRGRVFLLGGSKKVLAKMEARLGKDYPHVIVAGAYSPPYSESFSDADNENIVNRINDSEADVLWVGLGAPKQEKWIVANLAQLSVSFVAAVGAVFDFYTGEIKRTSPFFQRLGLEWLPRLIQEPRRLWRRNLVSSPLFLFAVAGEVIKKRFGR